MYMGQSHKLDWCGEYHAIAAFPGLTEHIAFSRELGKQASPPSLCDEINRPIALVISID